MKKIVIFILTAMIILSFVACDKENLGHSFPYDPDFTGYDINEECSVGDYYFTVTSSKIEVAAAEAGRGTEYFIILGVDTNLSQIDFSNEDNIIHFVRRVPDKRKFDLAFYSFDVQNKTLTYKMNTDIEGLDKLIVCDSDIEDKVAYLYIQLDLFDYKFEIGKRFTQIWFKG